MTTHRTRTQYFNNKTKLESDGIQVVLVDLPVGRLPWQDALPWSLEGNEEMFFDNSYPDGTYFVFYCYNGCPISGYTANKLRPQLPQYHFIDVNGWAAMYEIEKSNYLYEKGLW